MNRAGKPTGISQLVSQLLLEDADLRDIVQEFVNGLPARIAELREAYQELDWQRLALLAHRLKGAAGSYGYPDISRLCASMERSFSAHQADHFQDWIKQLTDLAAAAHAGLTDSP